MGGKNKNTFFAGIVLGIGCCIILLMLGAFYLGTDTAIAQVDVDPAMGTTFGLGTADLVSTIISIVQWALGFLGLVAVIMILYGGFVWMTAAGNQDKVAKAKKIITRAVIGLVIVLLAWAIVTFIIEQTLDLTGGPSPCVDGTWRGACELCIGGVWVWQDISGCMLTPQQFALREFQTAHDGADPHLDVHRCSAVKSLFNHDVDDQTIQDAITNNTIQVRDTGSSPAVQVTGDWVTRRKSVTFKHPNSLFEAFHDHALWMPESIADTAGLTLDDCTAPFCTYNGGESRYEWTFETNDTVDDVPPEIVTAYPQLRTHPQYPNRYVDRTPIMTVKFNESIDDTTIIDASGRPIAGNFVLEQLDGENGAVVGTYPNNQLSVSQTADGTGFEVYIEDPMINPLESFTWYRIMVANVEDLCSNPMAAGVDWEFQTNDKMPGVATWYPKNNKACPDTDIGIVFNTSMFYQEVSFTVTDGASYNINIGPIRPYNLEQQITDGNGNRLEVADYNPSTPALENKHFVVHPAVPLPTNTTFDVLVDTNMVMDIDGNTLDKTWQFTTATQEACACEPVIAGLSPNQGLNGECLTISGRCFKGTTNHSAVPEITFDHSNHGEITATVEGSDADGTWLTTTVPNPPYAFVPTPEHPDITVEIDYDDPEYDPPIESNPATFYINGTGEATGPCLYDLIPDVGYPNLTPVRATGIRFDAASAIQDIHFELMNDKLATVTAWADNEARGDTPNVVDPLDYGSNDVWIQNDAGSTNRLPFEILPIPPEGSVMLWYAPTCSSACVNANIGGLISKDVSASMDTANVHVYTCGDTACTVLTPVALDSIVASYLNPYTIFQVVLDTPPFVQNQRYRVVLDGTITNSTGGSLTGLNYDSNDDNVNDAFSWTFQTKDDPNLCQIASIDITPETKQEAINNTINYHAQALGSPDSCDPSGQILDPTGYSWNWGITDPLARSPDRALVSTTILNTAEILTENRTDNDPVYVDVTATDGTNSAITQGELTITDCETDQHCQDNCPGSNSVCDPVTNRCTPAVTALSPSSGPHETIVTVNGCYFGDTQGSGFVEFGSDIAPPVCGNTSWTDSRIIVQNPIQATGMIPVSVTTDSGHSPESGDTRDFTITNLCAGGASVPASGLPGLCPPLEPPSGKEGDVVKFNGFNLVGSPPNTHAQFSDGAGGFIDENSGSGTGTTYEGALVPPNAQTGPARVEVQGCASNALEFGISCAADTDCATGCCKNNICQDAAECSNGSPGQLCRIRENDSTPQTPENPNCATGPAVAAGKYDCYSSTGDTSSLVPPPPEPPPYGDDCRVCCDANPAQTHGNLECYPDKGLCTGSERGLYCGCVNDNECGDPTVVGCGNDNPRCCYQRPTFDSAIPTPGSTIHCTNQVINYTFDTFGVDMDQASMDDTTISVTDQGGNSISGSIIPNNSGFRFRPDPVYDPAAISAITIAVSEGVTNQYGVKAVSNSQTWTLANDATLCAIDHIAWQIDTATAQYSSPDRFTCALETGCSDDLLGDPGNQHLFTARAVDADGIEVTATYSNWTEDDPNDIIDLAGSGGRSDYVTANPTNGRAYVGIMATDNYTGSTKTGRAKVTVGICQRPWPHPYAPENDTFPFIANGLVDTVDGAPATPMVANFSTWYCRDNTDLPLLKPTSDVIVREFSPDNSNGDDEVVKEYFLLRDNTSDGIGIRILENEQTRSPRQWYRNQFGDTAPEPQELTVDGFEAVRAGRSVYVGVMNLENSALVPYIYLISYNEGASNDTIAIYNKLLANWVFNLNMLPTAREKMQRDLQRLQDLEEIHSYVLDYKEKNGTMPLLEGGTFVQGITTSAWPSWQDTLGSQVLAWADQLSGRSLVQRLLVPAVLAQSGLPTDPLNTFDVPDPIICREADGFDQNTCWNDQTKVFECPIGSHIYMYRVHSNGDSADLFATMEYTGPGTLINYAGDACQGSGGSQCPCYNYRYDATGTAQDHEGPDIQQVTHENGTPVVDGINMSGTWPLVVTVVDQGTPPSGVDRVEFFVDGIRKYTDTDSASWNWSFDTTEYAPGDYIFSVHAYDNVGNVTRQDYAIIIIPDTNDTSAPFVIFIEPAEGATVSGTAEPVTAQATDNNTISSFIMLVVGKSSWSCPNGAPSVTCTQSWNTVDTDGSGDPLYPNGAYTLRAVVTDANGNSYTAEIPVTVQNDDIVDPSVSIDTPTNGQTLNANITATGSVTDDQHVNRVEVYVDDILRGNATIDEGANTWSWDWQIGQFTNAPHRLTVIAYDDAGNTAAGQINVIINNTADDNEKPRVVFTRPQTPVYGADVFGNTTLTVDATDNIGIVQVNFYRDYIIRHTDVAPDYAWTFDPEKISAGWHTFQVDAIDAAGNRSEAIEIRLNIRGGGAPMCGDGIVTPHLGEECDGEDLNGQSCVTLGYDCGDLECVEAGAGNECRFNESQCVDATCGNGIIECNEQCEAASDCSCGTGVPQCNNCTCSCTECTPNDTRQCGQTDVGECSFGTQTCTAAGNWGSCIGAIYPTQEECFNSLDDDCDGAIDMADSDCATTCTDGDTQCVGSQKTQTCVGGVWVDDTFEKINDCSFPRWKGDCTLGSSCYGGTVACQDYGQAQVYCMNTSGTIQCNATCQSGFSDLYQTCCVDCNAQADPDGWCADTDPCTNDQCEADGSCSHTPVAEGTSCGTGQLCCGSPPICMTTASCGECSGQPDGTTCTDDGNVCTDDTCQGGTCTHSANNASCDDGNPCTTGDQCSGGSCQLATDRHNVLEPACGPLNNMCCSGNCAYRCQNDADCDDGNSGTTDTCVNGGTCNAICQYAMASNCGNITIDPNEDCDGSNLNGMTCEDFGYAGGTLGCVAPGSAQECTYDFSSCTLGCTGQPDGKDCRISGSLRNGVCKSNVCLDYSYRIDISSTGAPAIVNEYLMIEDQGIASAVSDSAPGIVYVANNNSANPELKEILLVQATIAGIRYDLYGRNNSGGSWTSDVTVEVKNQATTPIYSVTPDLTCAAYPWWQIARFTFSTAGGFGSWNEVNRQVSTYTPNASSANMDIMGMPYRGDRDYCCVDNSQCVIETTCNTGTNRCNRYCGDGVCDYIVEDPNTCPDDCGTDWCAYECDKSFGPTNVSGEMCVATKGECGDQKYECSPPDDTLPGCFNYCCCLLKNNDCPF